MLVKQLVEIFVTHVAQSKKPATARQYKNRLAAFVRKFGERELAGISSLEVEDYLFEAGKWPAGHARAGEEKSPDTRRANAIAFQQLQKFALKHKEIPAIILAEIEKPSGRERDRIPTEDESAKILQHSSPAFKLLYTGLRQSGARPNELARLRIEEHLDWQKGVISLAEHKTAGKTGKPRIIAIGKKFGAILKEAIGERTSGPVFLSPHGKAWTVSGISATYRRIREKAGLPRDLCCYLARHEHASKLCEEKGIHATAAALGHKKITTTQRYVKTNPEQLQNNQDLV